MSAYRIEFEKAAVKFIRKQDKPTQTRLLKAISKLPDGDVTSLTGTSGLYRLRVGTFRVLFSKDNGLKIITIENIDNRGQAYKRI